MASERINVTVDLGGEGGQHLVTGHHGRAVALHVHQGGLVTRFNGREDKGPKDYVSERYHCHPQGTEYQHHALTTHVFTFISPTWAGIADT